MVHTCLREGSKASLKFLSRSSAQRCCSVGNMKPSRDFILSKIKYKSNQIILEGLAYE